MFEAAMVCLSLLGISALCMLSVGVLVILFTAKKERAKVRRMIDAEIDRLDV